jgi:hypothetical protein
LSYSGENGILVDANLADGILARQRAAGEAVDVNLTAARTSRWSGQRLQIGLQIVRIVRQRASVAHNCNDKRISAKQRQLRPFIPLFHSTT